MASKNQKRADLNVRIPPPLRERLKNYAWTVNRPLTRIVSEALEQYLADKKIEPRPKTEA
jgi:predicted DNA-binding protein